MPIGKVKKILMNEETANRVVRRIAYEITERNKGAGNLVLIGIQKKGVDLAKAVKRCIKDTEGADIPLGSLDITFYRDDLTKLNQHPVVMGNDIGFQLENKNIILVDDVLFSGRTIRAAIDELFDMGRPDKIELAVLIDRGNRELPIQADYVGRNVPTSENEYINVEVKSGGEIGAVTLHDREV
ncbi:MAG: bifunctional pyr operon transcriptional regulator/uracil phosphoribosyltransferase PyrR [Firmicutes bacterium]|nr:bifunctional pyr operon transcriptional regulator/uracil phosphoribosyltransferase PyrR [Bacillota bacterium]